ncbi:unnamed protein product [Caenorhabditis nigoni]
MRYFLYPSNFINFFLAFLTFFLQFRNVHNIKSLAIMCQGPCKFLGPAWCFHGYIFILIFSYIPPIDLDFVYQETLKIHADYDFSNYKVFGGFANSHNIFMTLVTLILVILATIAPLLGFYWRNETLKILDLNRNALSVHSVMQFRALIHGLGLQIMIPLICYVPVGFFYVYNKYSGEQIQISQYTLCFMITLPAFFDPILQIYFIVPYRRAVKRMILQMVGNYREPESDVRVHTITLRHNRRKSSQPVQPINNI